jgi:hypothetical protein
MDTTRFLQQAITTARANLAYVQGIERASAARAVARAALQEAHSALSQRAFFAMLDALGGHEAVVQQIVAALEQPDASHERGHAPPERR